MHRRVLQWVKKAFSFVPEKSLHSLEVAVSAQKAAAVGEKGVFRVRRALSLVGGAPHLLRRARHRRKGRHFVLEESLC